MGKATPGFLATLWLLTAAAPAAAQAPQVGQLAAPPAIGDRQALDACLKAMPGTRFEQSPFFGATVRVTQASPEQDGFRLVTGEVSWDDDRPAKTEFACIVRAMNRQVVATFIPDRPRSPPRPGPRPASPAGPSAVVAPGGAIKVPQAVLENCQAGARDKLRQQGVARVPSVEEPELSYQMRQPILSGTGTAGSTPTTPERPFSYVCKLAPSLNQITEISVRLLPPGSPPRRQ